MRGMIKIKNNKIRFETEIERSKMQKNYRFLRERKSKLY